LMAVSKPVYKTSEHNLLVNPGASHVRDESQQKEEPWQN